MTATTVAPATQTAARGAPVTGFIVAWVLWLVFCFLQYALRSAPGVMIPELPLVLGLRSGMRHLRLSAYIRG